MMFSSVCEGVLLSLPSVAAHHAPTTRLYALLKQIVREDVKKFFSARDFKKREFKPFGRIVFPYHRMGAVDSRNLFDLDELILFSFYWVNRSRYRRVVDIGANIGLHSILMSRCGFKVRAYEPDPAHFKLLGQNLALNRCAGVDVFNAAVSDKAGSAEFIRVFGNTTSSHLAGAKKHPYGKLQKFTVRLEAIEPLARWADLIKIDVEGHEDKILPAISRSSWRHTDVITEVGSRSNARIIYDHFKKLGVNLFSQKINWQRVRNLDDVPFSYHDGSLFITGKEKMTWQ